MGKCKRVWIALRKPTKEEFWMTSKIAGIGVLILGFIGFIIAFIMNFLN